MSEASLKHVYTGKVRELYEVSHDRLLMVASDRVSVFDVVLPDEIPDKGGAHRPVVVVVRPDRGARAQSRHLGRPDRLPRDHARRRRAGDARARDAARPPGVRRAGLRVRARLERVPRLGNDRWVPRAGGLQEAEKLPEPLFTPTTKAEEGHDEALTPDEAIALVGADRYGKLRELSLRLYEFGARHAASCGVILADTKFEFGELDGEIILIDEVMTPDSSRYWPAEQYATGGSPPSFDKQFVRDYFDRVGWDRESPPPHMPAEVIDNTRSRYIEAYETITGLSFDEWFGPE